MLECERSTTLQHSQYPRPHRLPYLCKTSVYMSSSIRSLPYCPPQHASAFPGHTFSLVVRWVAQGKTITFGIRSPEEGSDLRSVELERTFPSTENPVVYALKVRPQGKKTTQKNVERTLQV